MDQTTSHPFVGREALLDEIKLHLLKGQHVALYGDRGIGKTAIVERVGVTANLQTTIGYLTFRDEDIRAAVEKL